MIEIQKKISGRYDVIRIVGRIGKNDIAALEDQLRSMNGGDSPIAVDIGDSSKAPMSLLAPLIALRNSSAEREAAVTLVNAPEEFRYIIQAAKLDHIFRLAPSIDSLKSE